MGRVTNALIKAGRWEDDKGTIAGNRVPFETTLPGSPFDDRLSTTAADASDKASPIVPPPPIPFPTRQQRSARTAASSATFRPPAPAPLRQVPRAVSTLSEPPALERPASIEPLGSPGPLTSEPVPDEQPLELARIADHCRIAKLSLPRLDPALVVLSGNDLAANEKYQTLAVRLFNIASKRNLTSVIVTSALEGEGKSTVAANLALVMARASDRRVLLIDADTKRPSIARIFGIAPDKGWKDILAGTCDPAGAIFKLQPSNLYVCADAAITNHGIERRQIPNGGNFKEPAHRGPVLPATGILASSRIERLLTDLEKDFGLIIIDTPPILEFAEGQSLATIAGGAIMVVSASRTSHTAVSGALKLIPKDRRLGVVLNQSKVEEESSYYGARKYRTSTRPVDRSK